MTIDVGQTNFEVEVLERSKTTPVVVDFWAPWCGPCRTLGPTLEALEAESGGAWILAKINTDQEQQLAQSFGIRGIPAVKAFVGGKVVDEFVGALPRPQIQAWLDKVVPPPALEVFTAADAALNAGDLDKAIAGYRTGLDDPKIRTAALVGLAHAEMARGDAMAAGEWVQQIPEEDKGNHARVISLVELAIEAGTGGDLPSLEARVTRDPGDVDARYSLGIQLATSGKYDEGLDQLLEVVIRDRSYRDDGARKAMVKVFEILGHDTETATRWRKRLGAAMY